jgi:hypothetical protein
VWISRLFRAKEDAVAASAKEWSAAESLEHPRDYANALRAANVARPALGTLKYMAFIVIPLHPLHDITLVCGTSVGTFDSVCAACGAARRSLW